MGTLKTKVIITNSDLLSDSIGLNVSKDITIAGNVKIRKVTTSTAAADIPGLVDDVGRSMVFLKNTDTAIDIKIYTDADNDGDADGDSQIMDIKPGEWAFFPWAGIQPLIAVSDSGTPVLEYACFTIA